MTPEADPFEKFRQRKLAENQRQKKYDASHGEVAGDLDPDTDRILKEDIGTGEHFSENRPKGFESHRYPQVKKKIEYRKPKGFQTHRYDTARETE